MQDQHDAWQRMTDARLRNLDAAVNPPKIRLAKGGRPRPPDPYEPGERLPLTRWLEVRVLAMELLVRLLLEADESRSYDLDVESLEDLVQYPLRQLEGWVRRQVEPDISRRETMAMILLARTILDEDHIWPLVELEEQGMTE